MPPILAPGMPPGPSTKVILLVSSQETPCILSTQGDIEMNTVRCESQPKEGKAQTWNIARALLAEDFCLIVEGFVEYFKIRLWKKIV